MSSSLLASAGKDNPGALLPTADQHSEFGEVCMATSWMGSDDLHNGFEAGLHRSA